VTPDDLWWLEPLSHASLLVEVIAPLALLARNVRVRALAAASLVGFHAGIVLALPIPFANIALVAALVFFFRDELMSWLARGRALPPLEVASRIATRGRLSVALVVTLGVAHLRLVPGVSYVSMAAYGVLWGAGLAQDYHLFNWISTVNYSIENRVTVEPLELVDGAAPHDVDPTLLFPRSLRMALVQTYLHDVKWAYASKSDRVAIKRMILPRAARRFCRTTGIEGRVRLTSRVQRITRASPVPDKGALSRNMLVFTCAAGEAHVEHMNVKVLTNKELRRAARRARR
jgi:hypothetical protein